MNKWNVHKWENGNWVYIGTVEQEDPHKAADVAAVRNGPGRYYLYPHIDNATTNGPSQAYVYNEKDLEYDYMCPSCGDAYDCSNCYDKMND